MKEKKNNLLLCIFVRMIKYAKAEREKTTNHTSVILEGPPPKISSPGRLLQMSRT